MGSFQNAINRRKKLAYGLHGIMHLFRLFMNRLAKSGGGGQVSGKGRHGKAGMIPLALGVVVVLGAVLMLVTGCGKAAPAASERGTPPAAEQPPIRLDDARVARGKVIYEARCAGCHGRDGVGENPANPVAPDEQGRFPAPPLDGSAHAWHHTDEDLANFIADGSPRNPRMKAWKTDLTREQIRDVVEYIKSLWGPAELNCQGPRHMDPDCFRGH